MSKDVLEKLLNSFASGDQVDGEGALKQILQTVVSASVPTEVTDIKTIDGFILDGLSCGDKIAKVTGKQKHLYTVTYKGDGVGEGICLTYHDASTIETVAYDYTADGWAYNSTDKSTFQLTSVPAE